MWTEGVWFKAENLEIDNAKANGSLEEGCSYTFLGVLKNVKQEDRIVLQNEAKVYLQRLSIIRSISLTDYHRVAASKQYALPLLTYFMWTQTWPLADLQQLNRKARKVIVENDGNPLPPPSLGSIVQLYNSRKNDGRGLRSCVERSIKLLRSKRL